MSFISKNDHHNPPIFFNGREEQWRFFFSDLLNHHQGRNNYINPLTDQYRNRNTYNDERTPISFIGKNTLRR
ncbi:hypothetical protein H8356DRAFT_1340752 [Neocallimastix lanati (nom. inval.)]|nr:hypothetical protein H8356DRAFT_1340752 [Neocallimastix sp. JGI-2020a]